MRAPYVQQSDTFMAPAPALKSVAALARVEVENYSLARLITRAAERSERAIQPGRSPEYLARKLTMARGGFSERLEQSAPIGHAADCLEMELHQALCCELGQPDHGGIYVPTRLRASGYDTKSNAAGKYTISSNVGELIDALVAQSRVLSLGATVVSGLTGSTSFPREANPAAANWVAENPGVDVGESDETFEQLPLSAKLLTATSSYSRKFLAQSTIAAEQFLRNRLMRGHAIAIDAAAINGPGTGNQCVRENVVTFSARAPGIAFFVSIPG